MTLIKLRTGTTAQWAASNPVLELGEPGHDSQAQILKVGDGVTPWTGLPGYRNEVDVSATYVALPGSDVADYSVAARKTGAGSHDVQWTTKEEHVARALGWTLVTDARWAGGAKGDGVADDTAAIIAAANGARATASGVFNAQDSVGGRLFFPPGVYLTTAPLTTLLSSGLEIAGAGQLTSRLVNNSTALIQVNEGTVVVNMVAANMSFETGGAGGHVLSIGNHIILTGALMKSVAYRALAVSPLPAAIPAGVTVSTVVANVNQQDWTTSAAVAAGATSIPVNVRTATANVPVGSSVTPPPAVLRSSSFRSCRFLTRNRSSSLVKQRGNAMFIANTIDSCDLDRQAGSTVPAVDVDTITGSVHNSNTWRNTWCHGHGTSAVPFFYVKARAGWHYNNSWIGCTGEQNGGGFIHLYACDGVTIDNCPDWDLSGTYTASVFKLAPGGAGNCNNWSISRSYRIASGGLAAGAYDIEASSSTQANGRIAGCSPPLATPRYLLNGDVTEDGRGQGFKNITAAGTTNLTLNDHREVVVNCASAVRIGLPAAANAHMGREFNIVNVGTGVVTILTTVSGTANRTLSRWGRMRVRTDGSTALYGRIWFMV